MTFYFADKDNIDNGNREIISSSFLSYIARNRFEGDDAEDRNYLPSADIKK
jgi:hypothetical protein